MNADPTKNNHTLTSSNTISTKVEMEPSDVTDTVGKMLIAGFEGCELKPGSQAEKLIRQYRVHSFILGTKNFRNVLQMRQLIQSLQNLAESEHYEYPLLLAVDQELGCCNSMYDDKFLTQFPGSMGLGATGNMDLIYKVGRAAGTELRSIGFNLYMGPVLDVVSSMANQLIGIRSFGFTAEDVTKCAEAFARGLKSSGMTICAKHFPGLGSSYVDNVLELPMMLDTMAQLKARHIIPFKKLIADGLMDAIHASGVAVPNIAPNEIHACLSPKIIKDLLRDECHFDGLAISECLELEALCKNIGLGQGVALSILYAGCDIVMICNDFSYQIEALSALHQAYVSGNHKRSFSEAIRRINHVLSKLTWPIPHLLSRKMMSIHHTLSVQAYQKSITLVRDDQEAIPISRYFVPEEENNVLVLTPLLTEIDHAKDHKFDGVKGSGTKLFPEETVFRSFGESLANYDSRLNYTVLHTSYTANGLTSAHEALIDSSKVIILFCAEASRNMFQIGVAKYISLLCGGYRKLDGFLKKPLIIVAVTSSYDFLYHRGIAPTYLCTFDYTESALSNIPAVLFGDLNPGGKLPGCNDAVQRNGEGIPSSSLMEAGNSKNMSLRMILNQDVLPDSLSEREINNSEDKVMLSQLTPVYPLETTKVINEEEPQKQQTFPSKPWLVENFDISRDFRSLILLLKNSGASDLQNTVDKVFIERLKKFLDETRAYSHHFVVRNSTLNLLLGVIFTWVDRNSSNGRILYVIVDKTKRRQSIASVLHQHAITNLKMEMGCKNIILGSDFPLFNFFKPNICEELYQNWGEIGIRHQISSCALQILQFTKSMKWWNSINKPIRRYILSVRMDTWRLIDNLIKQMKLLGIKLCIAENLSDIILLVQGSNMEEANQFSNLSELYMMAFKCIEDEERRRTKNTFVLKLVASSSQKPIGSIILYDAKSKLVNWLPFLSYVPSNSCGVTFLTGSFVDSDYGDLRPMLKMGLICTAVSFAKQLKSEMVMLDGCQCNEIVKLQQCGFQNIEATLLTFNRRIELYSSPEEASTAVADHIASLIRAFHPTEKRPFILGLPTGSSPLKVYARLITLYHNNKVDFSNVVSFNMDEYYRLPPTDSRSYHHFMYTNFFNHVNFKPENINILDGMANSWEIECQNYEEKIKSYGRINFFLGGMGPEGHLAFNESGSDRTTKTRRISLVDSTIKANSRFFENDQKKVPKAALTVGISTILDNSDEVCVVVFGKNKHWALMNTLTRKPTSVVPSTFLKDHNNSVIVADYAAIDED